MWRRVDLVWSDVSEERIASIFRVEKSASEEPAADCSHLFTLVSRSRIIYPEDGGDTFLRNVASHKIYTAPHPEDGILHNHRRENLKSYIETKFICFVVWRSVQLWVDQLHTCKLVYQSDHLGNVYTLIR
jgi:hypothetical protein